MGMTMRMRTREKQAFQPPKMGCKHFASPNDVLENPAKLAVRAQVGAGEPWRSGAPAGFENARLAPRPFVSYRQDMDDTANLFGYEALEILRSGETLHHANLVGANLSGADLRNVDLSGAELHLANLSGANLTGANLSDAQLASANLRDANLTNADLTSAYLGFVSFAGATLIDAKIEWASLYSADFSNADLTGASLQNTSVEEVQFAGANLSHADLTGVTDSDFKGAILTGAKMPDGSTHE